jgi:hypothetical protein
MSSENGSVRLETPGEQSTAGTTSTFEDDESDEEDWSSTCDVDDYDCDDGSCGPDDDNEPGEGAEKSPLLHAMVLLGYRQDKDGSVYWLLQNSWAGPMQVIEVSTAYLQASGAFLYFFDHRDRSPKPKGDWEKLKAAGLLCSAPVAESYQLERNDCEGWWEGLIHPQLQEEEALDGDDDSLCYYDI